MPNTCLADDKESLRRIAKALGKSEEWLKRGRGGDVWNWRGITVENQRVTRINWCGQELSGEIPKELGQLTSLKDLYLSSNKLTGEMPDTCNHASTQKFLEKCRNNRVSCINCYRHDYLISC